MTNKKKKTRRGNRGGKPEMPRTINKDEEVVFKVMEFANKSAEGGKSKQMNPDLFENMIAEGDVIRPLYDPLLWSMLLEQNTRLARCIFAMSLNTVGLGFELAPADVSKEFIESNVENIREERERLLPVFQYPNFEQSFEELMMETKIDEETIGFGFLEVSRSMKSEPDGFFHIPSHTVRVRANQEGYVQIRSTIGSDSYLYRNRGNVKQESDNINTRYFKHFGDTRIIDMNTGEVAEGSIPFEEQANELIMFKIYTPRSTYYGVPRYVAAAPAIAGNRLAQLRNVVFFENDSCLVYTEKVITPGGWTTMGELKVGDKVIGSNGKACNVTGVYPQKEKKDVYNVKFLNGTTIPCTDDHVWEVANVHDRKKRKTRRMTLASLMESGIRYKGSMPKWSIPLVDPVEYYDQGDDLPLDPYFLGLLLGDGCFLRGRVNLTVNKIDKKHIKEAVLNSLPTRTSFTEYAYDGIARFCFKKDHVGSGPSNLAKIVRDLGLINKKGKYKFIPETYLKASIEDRIALLQGLIDSDGSIQGASLQYSSGSEELSEGVKELVGSLGGLAKVTEVTEGRRFDVVIRRLPESVKPSRLPRKLAKYHTNKYGRWLSIDSVEHVGKEDTICIKVDADDEMYVITDFILTHNTPRMAVIVNGGNLDTQSVKMIEEFISAKGKGPMNAGRVMVLQAEEKEAVPENASKASIQLMPLTVGVTEDASFTRYQDMNNEEVRESFGIGTIFLGTAENVNKASAITTKQVTMEQVFEPEIRRYEYRINSTIMRALGAKYTKFKFKRPKIIDLNQEAIAYATLAAAGGVTPNDIRFLLDRDPFQGEWANTPIPLLEMGVVEGQEMPNLDPNQDATEKSDDSGDVNKSLESVGLKRIEDLYAERTGTKTKLRLLQEGSPEDVLRMLKNSIGDN